MTDRHPKWQRVEPGTVIPAGRPYRIEFANDSACTSTEWIQVGFAREAEGDDVETWFVDSSWKPPLDLPTEPTWGIAAFSGRAFIADLWVGDGDYLNSNGNRAHRTSLRDFIELTPEQVQRIEAAR